jgi:hypothetical protein
LLGLGRKTPRASAFSSVPYRRSSVAAPTAPTLGAPGSLSEGSAPATLAAKCAIRPRDRLDAFDPKLSQAPSCAPSYPRGSSGLAQSRWDAAEVALSASVTASSCPSSAGIRPWLGSLKLARRLTRTAEIAFETVVTYPFHPSAVRSCWLLAIWSTLALAI